MLIRLLFLRGIPLLLLGYGKSRRQKKIILILVLILCGVGVYVVGSTLIQLRGAEGLVYVPVAMFPHALFYGFAVWSIGRCLWKSWSERVWKRIYILSWMLFFVGILLESYINPYILRFFFGNFTNFF